MSWATRRPSGTFGSAGRWAGSSRGSRLETVTENPNPYAPPTAPLGEPGPSRRSVWWKVYLWALVGLSLLGYAVLGIQWMQPADVIDLVLAFVSLVGLFGYAYSRRIRGPGFWRLWLPLQVAWSLAFALLLVPLGAAEQIPVEGGEVPGSDGWDRAIGLALALPLYVALFLYAYRSPELWRRDPTS